MFFSPHVGQHPSERAPELVDQAFDQNVASGAAGAAVRFAGVVLVYTPWTSALRAEVVDTRQHQSVKIVGSPARPSRGSAHGSPPETVARSPRTVPSFRAASSTS